VVPHLWVLVRHGTPCVPSLGRLACAILLGSTLRWWRAEGRSEWGRPGMTDTLATFLAGIIGAVIGGVLTFFATRYGIQRSADAARHLAQQQHEWAEQEHARLLAEREEEHTREVRERDQEHAAELREREQARERERQELRRSVRLLINHELEHNVSALSEYWRRYCPESMVKGVIEEQEFVLYRGLADHPLPTWEHGRWQSLTTELPLALSADELDAVQRVHARLDTLTARRDELARLLPPTVGSTYDALRAEHRAEDVSLYNNPIISPVKDFLRAGRPLFEECWNLYRDIDRSQRLAQD